jgi:hypothetical protein
LAWICELESFSSEDLSCKGGGEGNKDACLKQGSSCRVWVAACMRGLCVSFHAGGERAVLLFDVRVEMRLSPAGW